MNTVQGEDADNFLGNYGVSDNFFFDSISFEHLKIFFVWMK